LKPEVDVAARAKLTARFGRDRPAAILGDVVAIDGAAYIVVLLT
jgi:uncharacterized membrane protein